MKAVIFGAGGVGLGFVGELLTRSGWQVSYADVASGLIAAINQAGEVIYNKVAATIEQMVVHPVSGIDLTGPQADEQLAAALANADLIFTAAGAGAFGSVGELLARAAESVEFAHQPLNVLCCENHKDAAAALAEATRQAMEQPELLDSKFAFVNTVVARMCQRLTSSERALVPVAPGTDTLIVAESYSLFPVDGSAAARPLPNFEGLRVLSGREFQAWDHSKLYAHNGVHALVGILGRLAGYTYMYECGQDSDLDAIARHALSEEVGNALVSAYPDVFSDDEQHAFAKDVYGRVTSKLFADTIARATRNTMRMIQPHDGRLSRAAQFVLLHGGEPRGLALGVAGVMILNDKSQQDIAAVLEHIDCSVRDQLVSLTQEAYTAVLAWQRDAKRNLRTFVE